MSDTRLDNMENNSDKANLFWERVYPKIFKARNRAKRNNKWAASRVLVNSQTGEIVTNKEGETLTLKDMSKSWYSKQGARNNAFQTVKRLQKAYQYECDLQKYRPKFITLTFAGDAAESWNAEKAIQKFLNAMSHWAKRQGLKLPAYFWAAEVQMETGRGALHYHILALGLPFLPKAQLRKWWQRGFIDIQARDDVGRAFKYTAKYLWKWGKEAGEPDDLPDWWFLFSAFSKRRYGFSKWFQLAPAERMPRWLKENLKEYGMLDDVKKASRAEGGGWLITFEWDIGEVVMHFANPFHVVEMEYLP